MAQTYPTECPVGRTMNVIGDRPRTHFLRGWSY